MMPTNLAVAMHEIAQVVAQFVLAPEHWIESVSLIVSVIGISMAKRCLNDVSVKPETDLSQVRNRLGWEAPVASRTISSRPGIRRMF